MLALARVLIHEPEMLMIDELSLGLAPLVVQRLLEVVEQLKAQGQTMIIVEQSLNVALVARRPGDLPREGSGPVRGPGRRPPRTRRPRPGGVLRHRRRLMTLSTVVTWNLLFNGVVGGLITALVAMGIVLVYRSTRVINFAVGGIGVPATALFAVDGRGCTTGPTGRRWSPPLADRDAHRACWSSWR